MVGQCGGRVGWQLGWCVWWGWKVHAGNNAPPIEQAEQPSVKQAEQASHSKQLFHVSDGAWCCHFRILSTPMDPFGASIATGVPGVRHVALH